MHTNVRVERPDCRLWKRGISYAISLALAEESTNTGKGEARPFRFLTGRTTRFTSSRDTLYVQPFDAINIAFAIIKFLRG